MRVAEGLQQFVLHQHSAGDMDTAPLSLFFVNIDRYMQVKTTIKITNMNNNVTEFQERKTLIKKVIIRFTLLFIIVALLILIPAGTINYWQVYVYLGMLIIPMVFIVFYFINKDPEFLKRRLKTREKEKQQKFVQLFFTLFFVAGFILPGLDKRFNWSDVPIWIIIATDIVILLGYILIFFVFKQNSYAARVVEVEKNQKVISSGLYSIVRHPMYVGVLIMYIPTPLALGSYWGLIPMFVIPLALIIRINNEEKVLRQELPGYNEYCQKTKYRLIPFIW